MEDPGVSLHLQSGLKTGPHTWHSVAFMVCWFTVCIPLTPAHPSIRPSLSHHFTLHPPILLPHLSHRPPSALLGDAASHVCPHPSPSLLLSQRTESFLIFRLIPVAWPTCVTLPPQHQPRQLASHSCAGQLLLHQLLLQSWVCSCLFTGTQETGKSAWPPACPLVPSSPSPQAHRAVPAAGHHPAFHAQFDP